MWSLESSVKARRSCLRIPSSSMKSRAPSLIVSVRSSFCSIFKCLLVPLTKTYQKSVITVEHDNYTSPNKDCQEVTYYSLEMQGFRSVLWRFPLLELSGSPVVSTGRDHPWTEPNKRTISGRKTDTVNSLRRKYLCANWCGRSDRTQSRHSFEKPPSWFYCQFNYYWIKHIPS